MKKIIRLTESDLIRIVKRVINESDDYDIIKFNNDDYLLGGGSFLVVRNLKYKLVLKELNYNFKLQYLN